MGPCHEFCLSGDSLVVLGRKQRTDTPTQHLSLAWGLCRFIVSSGGVQLTLHLLRAKSNCFLTLEAA